MRLYVLREEWPCHQQTEDDIAAYYRAAQDGDLACVRETQGGLLEYTFRFPARRALAFMSISLAPSMRSTARICYPPKGQTLLVVPTEEIIRYRENESWTRARTFTHPRKPAQQFIERRTRQRFELSSRIECLVSLDRRR